MIKGGCDLFTTKPITSDKKLYKTIDKHLTQLIQDNELSRTIEKERKNSINSLMGSSPTITNSFDNKMNISEVANGNLSYKGRLNSNVTDSSIELDSIDESPFGSLKNIQVKKKFANLIAILNTTFPDNDFSALSPTTENFHKISSEDLISRFNNVMMSLGKKKENLDWIWDRIDSHLHLIPKNPISPTLIPGNLINTGSNQEEYIQKPRSSSMHRRFSNDTPFTTEYCQIFEFRPKETSIIEDLNYPYQTMWSNYWFIYNKKKKKVAFIYLTAINKIHYSMVNGNRKYSNNTNKKNLSEIIGEEETDYDNMSMDDYEEVFIDDDDEDQEIDNIAI